MPTASRYGVAQTNPSPQPLPASAGVTTVEFIVTGSVNTLRENELLMEENFSYEVGTTMVSWLGFASGAALPHLWSAPILHILTIHICFWW